MLDDICKANDIINNLFQKTSITKTQLDTLLSNVEGKRRDITLNNRINLRDKKPVKIGAFLRSYEQAKHNIKSSIYTIILFQYLGLLTDDSLNLIIETSNIISKTDNENISNESSENILHIVDQIVNTLTERL
tara:strand:- start:317 stop:715 length:399 start_codon:yes stop_codon:yes gene_type:complete